MSEAMTPEPKDSPLMKAWEAYQATDDFKNSLIWATAQRYTDAGRNFTVDEPANQISDLQREQHAKGSLWAAFVQGFNSKTPPHPAQSSDGAKDELEQAYENINQLEDLLSGALAHLSGDPDYTNKVAVLAELQVYSDARKHRRGVGRQSFVPPEPLDAAVEARAVHTKTFPITPSERQNCSDLLIALWPHLKWRHAGFGALQAYICEGGERELRVHIWHPSLIKPGIEESGLCHDHRFDMRSSVLAGKIIQTEFHLEPDRGGDWKTLRVLHAREAMARGGSFHHDPIPTGDYFRRTPTNYEVGAGRGYTFDKFAFHETRAEGVTITLIEKSAQEDVNARILAPRGMAVVHAFTETQSPEEFAGAVADGLAALTAALAVDRRAR